MRCRDKIVLWLSLPRRRLRGSAAFRFLCLIESSLGSVAGLTLILHAFVAAARSAAHSAARSAAAIAATMARLAAGRAGLHMPQMLRQTARRKALAKYPWPAGSQKNGRSGAGPGTPAGEAGTGTAPAPCGRLPRTVRNSPCRLDGQSLAGRAGARWHSQTLDLVHQPGWKREGDP